MITKCIILIFYLDFQSVLKKAHSGITSQDLALIIRGCFLRFDLRPQANKADMLKALELFKSVVNEYYEDTELFLKSLSLVNQVHVRTKKPVSCNFNKPI